MLHQPISFHRHIIFLAKALFALSLISPAATEAEPNCHPLIEENVLPRDAKPLLEETRFEMNGQQFCVIGFRTQLSPEALLELYRDYWGGLTGDILEDPLADNPSAPTTEQTLLYAGSSTTRHIEVVNSDTDGSTATLSLMKIQPPRDQLTPDEELGSSDFEIIHDQHTDDGRTVMIQARYSGPELMEQIVRYLRHLGWQTEESAAMLEDRTTTMLKRDAEILTVTTGVDGNPNLALIQVISPSR